MKNNQGSSSGSHALREEESLRKELEMHVGRIDQALFRKTDPSGIVEEFMLAAKSPSQLDIEIAALFTAMISWGNRKAIRSTARKLLFQEMELKPARYVKDGLFAGNRQVFGNCIYRTLDKKHYLQVCENLRDALKGVATIEELVAPLDAEGAVGRIAEILSPAKLGRPGTSACKRICMFMRWMVRPSPPDFGIWKTRKPSDLFAVMDVHVNRQTAGMRCCKTPSWKGCKELTEIFRRWDPDDPLKYDVALMMRADANHAF